jgi:hypothetical protein
VCVHQETEEERDEEMSHQNTAPSVTQCDTHLVQGLWWWGSFNNTFRTEMDDKLKTIWKEMLMASSRFISRICLDGLRKTMKTSVRIAGVPVKIQTKHDSTSRSTCSVVQAQGFTDQSITRNITSFITNPHNIQKCTSYLKGNTPCLHYTDTTFN